MSDYVRECEKNGNVVNVNIYKRSCVAEITFLKLLCKYQSVKMIIKEALELIEYVKQMSNDNNIKSRILKIEQYINDIKR